MAVEDDGALLERLVARYSPSGHESAAVREFVRSARRLGYSARTDAVGNGLARVGRGHPRIVFLGHIDTVEGRLPVRRARGRLYGRGAVDAKGPLAAALRAGVDLPGSGEYLVVASVGEETDSRGARHLAPRLRPDAVIAGEPSGWAGVTVGYKGELRVTATFCGRRTHYSSPCPTAADRAVDWLGAVRAIARERSTDSRFRSLTAKAVALETEGPGDRERARVTVDLRLPPGLSTTELLGRLRAVADRPALAVSVRVEPLDRPASDPVARALIEGIRAVGGRPTVWRKAGTSDLNLVAPVWNVPGAAYGPGDARLDHTDRESVSLAELERSVAVLRVALARLRGAVPTLRRSAAGA